LYKEIRPLVQHGQQFWLRPPAAIGSCGVQYVSAYATETVVMMYPIRGLRGAGARRMRLRGLQPAFRYRRDGGAAEGSGAPRLAAGTAAALVGTCERRPTLDWQSAVQMWRSG